MADFEAEVRAEMAEIKSTLTALTKSLVDYGKARVDGVQDQASDWSDEVLAESRRATKKLAKQVSMLEKNMETTVCEHPLQWFLGALGIGLVVAMLVQKSRD